MADPTQNTELSELEKKLSTESKLAAYRKEIAIANQEEAKLQKQILDNLKTEKETLKSDLKAPEIKGLEGKITSTGNFIESQILASKCLSEITQQLVNRIFESDTFKPTQNKATQDSNHERKNKLLKKNLPTGEEPLGENLHPGEDNTSVRNYPKLEDPSLETNMTGESNPEKFNFIIYNILDFPKIEFYVAILDHVKTIGSYIQETIAQVENSLKPDLTDQAGGFEPITFGLATAGILRTAADIFSLFKTNSTLTHLEFTPDEEYIISGFVSNLKTKEPKCNVYYPGIYPVLMIDTFSSDSSEFIKSFTNTKNLATQTSQKHNLIGNEIVEVETELLTTTNPVKKSELEYRLTKLKSGLERLQTSTNSFSQFEMFLLEIDPITKVSLRAVILNAEKLVKLLKKDNTYIIKLSAKLNGSTRINENLWRQTCVMHSGGAQLNCLIFSKDGSIVFSDNLNSYSPYKIFPDDIKSSKT